MNNQQHTKTYHPKVCVIIPTYNNEKTLKKVLDGVLQITSQVIVINDGSTDNTSKILASYQKLQTLTFKHNKGKGKTLREGFKKAIKLGYQYAITIDSDGQHYPEDIPKFLEALSQNENKNLLLIGSRDMSQDSVPSKSSFGNKFSNFWFWFETGIQLTDTQSGFRLYPLKAIKKLKFFTTKFEFEIEVIVKLAWQGTTVKNIPIQVLYDENERVSHFRPFQDFTRISILNTYLVIISIFYIKPRDFFRNIKKKGSKQFIQENILGTQDAPLKKAASAALGVLIGMSPLWGFQTAIVLFLAIIFRLNKPIAFLFSNVSLPPFIPFIVFGGIKTGEIILNKKLNYSITEFTTNLNALQHVKVYLVGSIILAFIVALIVGFISYFIFLAISKKEVKSLHE